MPDTPELLGKGRADQSSLSQRPNFGRATAAAIPGARRVSYPGMGHDLPRALWPSILGEISALAARSQPVPQELR